MSWKAKKNKKNFFVLAMTKYLRSLTQIVAEASCCLPTLLQPNCWEFRPISDHMLFQIWFKYRSRIWIKEITRGWTCARTEAYNPNSLSRNQRAEKPRTVGISWCQHPSGSSQLSLPPTLRDPKILASSGTQPPMYVHQWELKEQC